MPYGGGQIIEINSEEMTVTFVAHRGWGPDGRTIYYIVTDATPGPFQTMGVISSPSSSNLITSPAAVDLFQFKTIRRNWSIRFPTRNCFSCIR